MKKILILTFALFTIHLSFAQKSEKEIVDRFFELYKTNTNEAVNYIYGLNKWIDLEGEAVRNVRDKLNQYKELVGTYYGEEFIYKGEFGQSFVTYIYLVKYERQPIRFTFKFYKAKDTWMTYSFSFDDNFDEEFEEIIRNEYMRGKR